MEFSRKLFPRHHFWAITNGVHSYTWTCPHFRKIFDRYIPGWANEPELLVRVDGIPNDELWNAHVTAKNDLVDFVGQKSGTEPDASILTIGCARRATAYKRATLVFSDLEMLLDLMHF